MKNSFLPELILCEPDQVFRKRSKPKILKHPEYNPDSIEFKYSSVLLYHSLGDQLDNDAILQAFDETDENGEKMIAKNKR